MVAKENKHAKQQKIVKLLVADADYLSNSTAA